jgi:hypothetical protein
VQDRKRRAFELTVLGDDLGAALFVPGLKDRCHPRSQIRGLRLPLCALELLKISIKLSHAAIGKRDQYACEIGRFETAMKAVITHFQRGFWRMDRAAGVIFVTMSRFPEGACS